MKFIQIINSSANKFAKGMVGIFAIKLLLFGGAFLIQSCQTDEIEDTQTIEQEFALLKFEGIVRSSIPRIQSAVEKQQSFTTNSMTTLSIETQQQNEDEIVESLKPLVEGSRELFYAFELSDNDIEEILDNGDSSTLAMLGLTFLAYSNESKNNNDTASLDLLNSVFNIQTANGQDWGAIGGCAIGALGLDSLGTLKDALQGKKVTAKALKKAVKKVAKKFAAGLSGWGTAILVAEFAICVGVAHAF